MAEGQYQLRLKNTSGVLVNLFDAFERLSYSRQLNAPGYYEVVHLADDPRLEDYVPDALVEFWRRPVGGAWRVDYEALHRRRRWWTDESGVERFSSIGRGYEDLLSRRIMIPGAGDEYDSYSDNLTDVLRAMARTHCGVGAAVARQMAGFAVQADDGAGPAVQVDFRYDNLLGALQEMANYGADFAVVGTGPATFEFRAYWPYRGTDRTVGNILGNPPVTFDINLANMDSPQVIEDWLTLANYVYVAGQGEAELRTIRERSDATSIAETPWGRRESFYDQRQLSVNASLDAAGDRFLAENAKVTEFAFRAIEQNSCRYGVHWDLGDLVTARYRTYQFDIRVVQVNVSLTRDQGEVITPTIQVLWAD